MTGAVFTKTMKNEVMPKAYLSANDNRLNHAKAKSNKPITFTKQYNQWTRASHVIIVSEFPQVYVSRVILIKGCTSGAFDSTSPWSFCLAWEVSQPGKAGRQEYYYTHLEDLHILSPWALLVFYVPLDIYCSEAYAGSSPSDQI